MLSALSITGIYSFLEFLKTQYLLFGYIQGENLFPEPLSAEEERNYLEQMSKGDDEARNILIERNLRLVAYIAKKYSTAKVEQERFNFNWNNRLN